MSLEKMYVPPTKEKLLESIGKMRPDYRRAQLARYHKARLYAIYFTLRKHAAQANKEQQS